VNINNLRYVKSSSDTSLNLTQLIINIFSVLWFVHSTWTELNWPEHVNPVTRRVHWSRTLAPRLCFVLIGSSETKLNWTELNWFYWAHLQPWGAELLNKLYNNTMIQTIKTRTVSARLVLNTSTPMRPFTPGFGNWSSVQFVCCERAFAIGGRPQIDQFTRRRAGRWQRNNASHWAHPQWVITIDRPPHWSPM